MNGSFLTTDIYNWIRSIFLLFFAKKNFGALKKVFLSSKQSKFRIFFRKYFLGKTKKLKKAFLKSTLTNVSFLSSLRFYPMELFFGTEEVVVDIFFNICLLVKKK